LVQGTSSQSRNDSEIASLEVCTKTSKEAKKRRVGNLRDSQPSQLTKSPQNMFHDDSSNFDHVNLSQASLQTFSHFLDFSYSSETEIVSLSNTTTDTPATNVEFEVEAIVKRRTTSDRHSGEVRDEWLTKWKGWPKQTWEPKQCFVSEDGTVNDIWEHFENSHKRKRSRKPEEAQTDECQYRSSKRVRS